MDFGREQLEKFGWTEGQGLGRDSSGIKTYVRVARKTDNLGIGANYDWSEEWWSKLYDGAASNASSAAGTPRGSSSSSSSSEDSDDSSSSSSSSDDDGVPSRYQRTVRSRFTKLPTVSKRPRRKAGRKTDANSGSTEELSVLETTRGGLGALQSGGNDTLAAFAGLKSAVRSTAIGVLAKGLSAFVRPQSSATHVTSNDVLRGPLRDGEERRVENSEANAGKQEESTLHACTISPERVKTGKKKKQKRQISEQDHAVLDSGAARKAKRQISEQDHAVLDTGAARKAKRSKHEKKERHALHHRDAQSEECADDAGLPETDGNSANRTGTKKECTVSASRKQKRGKVRSGEEEQRDGDGAETKEKKEKQVKADKKEKKAKTEKEKKKEKHAKAEKKEKKENQAKAEKKEKKENQAKAEKKEKKEKQAKAEKKEKKEKKRKR